MEAWFALIIGVVGMIILLAMLGGLWTIVIDGLAHTVREKRGEDQPDLPRTAH